MDNNRLLVTVEVDTAKGEASIKNLNRNFGDIEKTAKRAFKEAKAGQDGMNESMTVGVLKANLFTAALERGLHVMKEWTVEAAKYAARTETLRIVTDRLALSNGLSVRAINDQVQAVKRLGITTQEAHNTVNQMVVAQLDAAKAPALARLAQNAAVVGGVNSSDALNTIIAGITEQRVQMLRTVGISVSFEQAFRRQAAAMGKTTEQLTEYEKKQIALNEVLRKAPQLEGAYEAAMGTAGKQMSSLARHVDEAKGAIGEQFLPALGTVVSFLTSATDNLHDHAEGWANLAKAVVAAAVAFGTFKGLGAIGVASSIGSPIAGLIAALAGLVTAFTLLKTKYEVQREAIRQHGEDLKRERDNLDRTAVSAKEYADQLDRINHGLMRDDLREARNDADEKRNRPTDYNGFGIADAARFALKFLSNPLGTKFNEQVRVKSPIAREFDLPDNAFGPRGKLLYPGDYATIQDHLDQKSGLTASERAKLDAEKEARDQENNRLEREARQRSAAADRNAANGLAQARAESAKGNAYIDPTVRDQAYIDAEKRAKIAELSSFVDEKTGEVKHFRLSRQAMADIEKEFAIKRSDLRIKHALEVAQKELDILTDIEKQRFDLEQQQAKVRADFYDQNKENTIKAIRAAEDFQLTELGYSKDAQLRQLSGVNAITVEQKIGVEQRKLDIEREYLDKSLAQQADVLKRRTELEIQQAQAKYINEGGGRLGDFGYNDIRVSRESVLNEQIAELTKKRNAEVAAASDQAAINSANVVRDNTIRVFDSLKHGAEGVLDQLLTKSKNIFQAMGDALKSAVLTAIKDILSSKIALALTRLTTGQDVRMQNQSGPFGSLGIGALPYLGAAAMPAAAAPIAGGGGGSLIPGFAGGFPAMLGPGGTAGFAGPVALSGGGGSAAAAGGGLPAVFNPIYGPYGGAIPTGAAGSSGSSGIRGMLGSFASMKGLGTGLALSGGMLGLSGIQKGSSASTIAGFGMMGGGIGLLGGPIGAVGGLGIGLAANGLRQGGIGGLAQTTAGGALLGFNLGGPLGAAIGAGVGLIAGTVRLFIKGKTEQVQQQVKSLYHLSIDKTRAQQIAQIADQKYGGSISMAIRSKEVVDMLMLYAQSTGQNFGVANVARSAALVQQGGQLYQAAGAYDNGRGLGYASSILPSFNSFSTIPTGKGSDPTKLVVSLDGQSSAAFLQGQTVNAIGSNPRAVADAYLDASSQNYGRQESATSAISPGTLIR